MSPRFTFEPDQHLVALIEAAGLDPAHVLSTGWDDSDPTHAVVVVADSFDPLYAHQERVCRPDTPEVWHLDCPPERHAKISPTWRWGE